MSGPHPFPARYDSWCHACNLPWKQGALIAYYRRPGETAQELMHAACAKARRDADWDGRVARRHE